MQSKQYVNPLRRNRNIGTSKQGRGSDNKHVVPQSWRWKDGRVFYEHLRNAVVMHICNGNYDFRLFVEPTNNGFAHPCTPDDIMNVLSLIPESHSKDIKIIVLRQPTKKEELLRPAWGRMSYFANLGDYSGPGIFLNACQPGLTVKWTKSLTPEAEKELLLLREHGHAISSDKRNIIIKTTIEACRNTQLCFTVPHEVGHYVHYNECVADPMRHKPNHGNKEMLEKQYFEKSLRDVEAYANKYANGFYSEMKQKGVLPFPRILDVEKIREQGMKPEWFSP